MNVFMVKFRFKGRKMNAVFVQHEMVDDFVDGRCYIFNKGGDSVGYKHIILSRGEWNNMGGFRLPLDDDWEYRDAYTMAVWVTEEITGERNES